MKVYRNKLLSLCGERMNYLKKTGMFTEEFNLPFDKLNLFELRDYIYRTNDAIIESIDKSHREMIAVRVNQINQFIQPGNINNQREVFT
jgi:hypothetical protein